VVTFTWLCTTKESQKLQYAMEARLRQLGWREIEVAGFNLITMGGCSQVPGTPRYFALCRIHR
jgi:hypothetical protein